MRLSGALAFLLVIGLSGCKNLTDLRSKEPDLTLASSKSVESVAECLLFGWQSQKLLDGSTINTFIQPYPGGKTVYTENYTAAADIVKYDAGTQVRLYLRSWYIRDSFEKISKTCI
ncbi:hypothetical protein L8O24_18275 [Enterobacter kobei]|uniref:hypothetical protein n=1 Tax=Enterobacter kobei TaxID=208224 RepID=UPI001ABEBDA0|nr:hypothetical protein [Enterobacter kobei]MBO4158369.1 hypothetical protein [Enterobacter kobei]MCK7363556.1 hypothetical protein [Enterobacter kobei]HDW1096616.1 hypothetical protein [Enterobacter kobei]HED5668016.1 hypothetical protein [Enterobacter kobei]HEG2023382.1 hypothetical protein [Enterobacter kobei]